jgi:AcrR family transcriptional regulator
VNEHSSPRWLPADERRQLILDAARRAFSRRGDVGRTTIKDIAAEAKISEGNIYRYFDSKEELFYEAAVRPLQEAFALGDNKMQSLFDLPVADRHATVVDYYRDLIKMLEDLTPLLGLVMFGDPQYADPFYRDVLRPHFIGQQKRWREVSQGIGGGSDLPTRYEVFAHFGVVLMCALEQRRSENPPDLNKVADELARQGYALVARDQQAKKKPAAKKTAARSRS